MKKIELNEAKLHKLRNKGLTLKEIAKELGIGESTLDFKLKESGISLNKLTSIKADARLNREKIIELYESGNNIASIAKEVGVSRYVIGRLLKREGNKRSHQKVVDIEYVKEQLLQGRAVTNICVELNIHPLTLRSRIEEKGLDWELLVLRDRTCNIINQKELEILTGELLGDGYLSLKGGLPLFIFSNTKEDYTQYLRDNLSILNNKNIYCRKGSIFTGRQGKEYYRNPQYVIKSKTECCLEPLYKSWYPEGKKIVPKDIKLTPLVLRHWIYGDGYIHKDKWMIQLSTNGFTKEDVEFLISKLKELELKAKIREDKYKNSNNVCEQSTYSIIISNKESVIKVLDMIDPCVIPSLSYKHKRKS